MRNQREKIRLEVWIDRELYDKLVVLKAYLDAFVEDLKVDHIIEKALRMYFGTIDFDRIKHNQKIIDEVINRYSGGGAK